MRCNFREETKCPDGGFLITTCLREAEIGDLCYKCAYEKALAELALHRWIPISEGPPKPGRDFEAYSNTEEFPHSVILTNQWPEGAIFTHYRYITLPKGD